MSKTRFVQRGLVRAHSGRAGDLIARDGVGASFESLESRQLLAAISWDGGGGDNLWQTAANWSGDVVPTAADDVTIDVAGSPAIGLSGADRAVNSLVLRETLTIAGRALTVGTTAVIESGAVLNLNNARLTGGTWTANTGSLAMDSSPGNILTSLTWNGAITLPDANDRLSIGTGVAINGVVTVSGASAEIGLASGAVLNAEVVFPGATTGRKIGATAGNITYTLGAAANIHGGVFSIGGTYGGAAWGGVTVVNNGTVTAETAGQTLTINPATFTNVGTLNANPGNITVTANSWSSSGSFVNVNTGTFTIDGTYVAASGIGTWTRSGGAVNVPGAINNAGNLLTLNASTGMWDLVGGSISGGIVTIGAGGGLGMNNNLNNRITSLTFNGDITLADANDRLSIGASVNINGVITVSGVSAEIGVVNGAVLNTQVVFPGNTAGRKIGATAGNITYSLGPAANVHGGVFSIGGTYGGAAWGGVTVINQGVITAETADQTVTINPAIFQNLATLNAGPGNLNVSPGSSWTSGPGTTINVSAGAFTIDGTFVTLPTLGTWNRTGGAVNVAGNIDNTNGFLTLNASTGVWDLVGGNISGGTVNIAAGGGLGMNSSPSNRLSNLTFNGAITLADANDRLSFGTNVVVNGVITVSGASAEIGLANGASLNTEIVFPGTTTGRRIGATAGNITYSLGPASNVHGGVFTIGGQYGGSAWGGVTVANQGVITAEIAGQTVTINPANFNSDGGRLNAGPGNITIQPSNNWSTVGATINVNAGVLTMGGTYVTGGGIGAWTRAGGSVNVTGVVDNTGGNLNLNASTGPWDLVGGAITGGTLNLLAGGGLGVNSDPGNRLSNITVNGNVTLPDTNDRLSFGQTVTINGVTTLSGQNTELGLVNGAVLNSEVVFPGTTAGRRIGATAGNITYTLGSTANVHGGPFTIGGQYGGSAWGNVTVVNQGTIAADVAGQTAFINPAVFNNTGTLTAGPGNLTVNTAQTWSTIGTVNINNVTFSIDGTLVTSGGIGTWNRTGGAVNVPGTIQNTGGIINLNAGTGVWALTGGSIIGGVVNIVAGGGIDVNSSASNRLDNTMVIGGLTLADASDRISIAQNVSISGVVNVTGANAEIGLTNGAVLNAEVVFPGATSGRRIGATAGNITYTLGPSANIHGGAFTIGGQFGGSAWGGVSVVNQGTITAETAGQTVTINPANFTNSGTIAATPGNVAIAPSSGATTNAGTIRVAPGSTVAVTGTYTQTKAGTLHIQIDGDTSADSGHLVVSGTATLGGTLRVTFEGGFAPLCMNVIFLDAPSVVGEFDSNVFPTPADDHQALVVYFGNQVRFAISPPSDYNQDGILNSQDLFDFLTGFFAEDADFNGDGMTNSQDFFDFLTDFFEGC